MGAVKIDTEKKERQYSVKYTLNDAAGVKALLRDRHKLASRRFSGDYSASDIIIDLHSAMNTASLTERQTEAIAWVYGADLAPADTAKIMGVTRQAVEQFIDGATDKIAKVYHAWDYGEITAELAEDGADDEGEAV
jgi:DNA-directed RNA polymerase specialized sigma subunit